MFVRRAQNPRASRILPKDQAAAEQVAGLQARTQRPKGLGTGYA